MPHSHLCTPSDHLLSRRQILGAAGAVGLGTLLRPAVADDLQKQQKQVLFIWIDGGMSQLESWDPKPNTLFGGPFRAIPTSLPGVHGGIALPYPGSQTQSYGQGDPIPPGSIEKPVPPGSIPGRATPASATRNDGMDSWLLDRLLGRR